jgi:hypothetical protein
MNRPRVLDQVDAHDRRPPGGDPPADGELADRCRFDGNEGRAARPPGPHVGIHLEVGGLRANLDRGRVTLLRPGGDDHVGHVVVDQDRGDDLRPAAARPGAGEQAVIDEHLAADLLDRRRDLLGQVVQGVQRVGIGDLGVHEPAVGVGVVVVGKQGVAVLAPAAAERQVAARDQDQVAVEDLVTHLPAAVEGGGKGPVRAQLAQGGGARVELGDRGGQDEFVRVVLVDGPAGLGVDDEDAPAGGLVLLRVGDRPDPVGEVGGAGGGGEEQEGGNGGAHGGSGRGTTRHERRRGEVYLTRSHAGARSGQRPARS